MTDEMKPHGFHKSCVKCGKEFDREAGLGIASRFEVTPITKTEQIVLHCFRCSYRMLEKPKDQS